MKRTNHQKVLTAAAILGTIAVMCFIILSTPKRAKSMEKLISYEVTEKASLEGNSEFYLKPAGDERLWHVINTYTSNSGEAQYNNSSYLSAEILMVVNKYVVDADNQGRAAGRY
jgi:hypothetical protein